MTVSITCSGNLNCIGHCCVWDWSDFVSNCIMGLFWTGDWIQVRHNVVSFSRITTPIERRSVTSRHHLSWQRWLFASSNDGRKYGLLLCSWVQSCTGKSYMSFSFFVFDFFFGICRTMFWWDPKIILLQQQRDVSLFKKKRTTNPLQFNDLYTKLANSISDVTNPYINNLWVWAMYSLTFFRHSSQCLFGHCRW